MNGFIKVLARWWPNLLLFCIGILLGMVAYREREAPLKMLCDITGGSVVYDNDTWSCNK